ncbi:hypothetical protein CHLNCDRAFT_133263 [Chlorella variabilis]|uniref:RRM domain-containing protein n=1 Tax=Chlorella variabilis TaxID=554065 RepID=E1Z2Q8_CHLVA|nr:hypothetical protein CHLNCDRAFT_133263 [Chlorella variabilis]EFN60040.1 hypothetical protein CHLNCDRAFT_133263 [Chlorella variabilis]|eukprot:XP_005852142.1 hypothetical protein CHLNCDRAFT_133263 [Chlorella variabilis]
MTTSKSRIPSLDPKSAAGLAVTTAVQGKLRHYLGADYEDRSLAQYVVIMLAHKTGQEAVAENLVEFLGEVDSKEVASWWVLLGWLFENLNDLVKPPPAPQQEQQQPRERHPERAQRQRASAAAPAAAEGEVQAAEAAEAEDALELEMEQDEGSEGEVDGSDADTAEVAMEEGHGGGGAMRRLQSAVVRDEYRARDERSGRSDRSRSPRRYSPPHHRRGSHSPRGGGRRHSPAARRRSPPRAGDYFWDGASRARYSGHDPYPYRTGGGAWRGDRSPPRRRRSTSPGGARGHGHGDWQQARSPRGAAPPRGAYRQEEPQQAQGGGGGDGGGVFGRLQPWEAAPAHRGGGGGGGGGGFRAHHHFQHDLRWEDGEGVQGTQQQPRLRSSVEVASASTAAGVLGGAPPGLAPGVPHPGSAGQQQYDAGMGQELLPVGQQGQQGAARSVLPWERPSYMDLEVERQRQAQAQQQQAQQQQQLAGQVLALPAAAAAAGGPVAGAFARALAQAAAASMGLDGRSVLAVPLAGQQRGGAGAGAGTGSHGTTFQVTISHQQGPGAAPQRHLTAPLLRQPDLQAVLRQRVRQMEVELVALRTQQAERQLEQAQTQQHLSAAARLALTIRSVCIKGVHPAASDRVLIAHFGACGYIQRITHLRDPASGRRSGVAYMQFSTAAEAQAALALDGSALLQRTVRVVPSDSPAARVAASRVLRAAQPPPGLLPIPMFAAPISPRMGRGRSHHRGGGNSGRGGRGGGRGHGSFRYVRPADQAAPGPGAAGDGSTGGAGPKAGDAAAAATPAALAAAAGTAGHGGAGGDTHMAD